MNWEEKLAGALRRGEGVRFGETAVVSRRVHLMDPREPREVVVLRHADAGQIFYGRQQREQVLHLDLFHQEGMVDHRRVAAAVRLVLARAGQAGLAHYVDIQTATGGGRVTGSLTYGNKATLRDAHRNHIHLAAEMGDGSLAVLFPLVTALEEEVMAQGLEIRRIERLRHSQGSGRGGDLDMSDYADHSDSWLRGPRAATGGGVSRSAGAGSGTGVQAAAAGTGRGPGAANAPGTSTPGSANAPGGSPAAGGAAGADIGGGSPLTGSAAPGDFDFGTGSGAGGGSGAGTCAGAAGGAFGGTDLPARLVGEERLQAALTISRRVGSPDELKRTLDRIRSGGMYASSLLSGTQTPYLIRELEERGLVRREGRTLHLTEAGRQLAEYFDRHLREIKLRFRKLIRRVPRNALPPRAGDRPSPDVRYGPVRGVVPVGPGKSISDLAVPETVLAGLRRSYLRRVAAPGSRGRFSLERQDLRVYTRAGEQPLYICLLIDASASMAGRRILAAKHLVRHLLASTRDRIAVVAFQERDVRVYVPFTRDYARVEEGLARIQPMGLTPLAHGLTASLELMRVGRVRRPLLLLITDGIPTVPKWSIDPLADALEAARQVARSRVPFGCIGLMPSRRYLEELSRAAGGTLHVVEELNEDALVRIAHRERLKQRARR